jgi:hypothetical protein
MLTLYKATEDLCPKKLLYFIAFLEPKITITAIIVNNNLFFILYPKKPVSSGQRFLCLNLLVSISATRSQYLPP